jgi:HECT-domain (ubiquitin-transferase)
VLILAGADAGGPRRAFLSDLGNEIYHKLKLFIKTPNAVHNVGEERDKWVPNPKANSCTDLENFYKLGMVMALAKRLSECLQLSLPSIFWSYLLTGKALEWDDIKYVNLNQWVCINKISTMEPQELEYLEESFCTFLNDGREYELLPNGKNIKLTVENRSQYVSLSKALHISALMKPFYSMRRGFIESIYPYVFQVLFPSQIEKMISGMDYVNYYLQ